MPGPHQPPPGAIPSGAGSPDMGELMEEMAKDQQGTMSGSGQSSTQQALSSALQGKTPQHPKSGPSIGSPVGEAKYLGQDVAEGLLDFLPGPLKSLLNIRPSDTPEEQQRKRQMIQNYQRMNEEQRQYVAQEAQKQQALKQQQAEEDAQRRQMEAQQRASSAEIPQGKRTGDMNANQTKKQQAVTKMQNDRKKLSNAD